MLAAGHGEFARRAAAPGADRFAEPLRDALAVIECDLEAEHPAATTRSSSAASATSGLRRDGGPLVYFAGGFGTFRGDWSVEARPA